MQIYEIDGLIPVISPKAFVHESAVIIGDVFIEEGVYIGPLASIRGDFGRIIIKKMQISKIVVLFTLSLL